MNKPKTAVAFPGQGVQDPGMAQMVYKTEAWRFFQEASALLGYDLGQLCLTGPPATLAATTYAQPAVFVTGYALWHLFGDQAQPALYLGHSLGEITALAVAGAISFSDGVRFVAKRGEAMARAGANKGGMAAIVGLKEPDVEGLCRQTRPVGWIQVANFNSPQQIVVSGERRALHKFTALAQAAGARRVIPLNVSGPFHSQLMAPAAKELAPFLAGLDIKKAAVPVLDCDGTTVLQEDPQLIRAKLVDQITKPVRFVSCIEKLVDLGLEEFVEVSHKPLLANLARRIAPSLKISLVTERGI